MLNVRFLFISSFIIASAIANGPAQGGTIEGTVTIKTVPATQRPAARGGLYAGGGGGVSHSQDQMQQLQDPAHVLVYIDGYKSRDAAPPKEPPVLDQNNLEFVPHILPIMVGTTVRFPNSDDVYHNAFSYSKPKSFDLGRYPKGKSKTITFDQPGIVKVFCEIHAHMSAIIVVLENPFFDMADTEGRYRLENVPAGAYTLKTWHEALQPVSREIRIGVNESITVDFDL